MRTSNAIGMLAMAAACVAPNTMPAKAWNFHGSRRGGKHRGCNPGAFGKCGSSKAGKPAKKGQP